MTFANHGCNGTNNFRAKREWNEMYPIMDGDNQKPCIQCMKNVYVSSDLYYDPYHERHYPMWQCQSLVANRDIDMGEEVLDNYVDYIGTDESLWFEFLDELQHVCTGGIGYITQYDNEKD
jgi:hypothetical protein